MQVTLEFKDKVAVIVMDGGKKNAITHDGAAQILTAVEQAEATADAIVLAGRPSAFCAGFDLAKLPASACSGNKLEPRRQALAIMTTSLNG